MSICVFLLKSSHRLATHTLSSSIFRFCFCPTRTLSIYGSRREHIACGCMCRLDVTLAQSSSIAPDSSPRRVHLDAAVRGRLLRQAHLESLQHPASTSRGKYTFRVHAPLQSYPLVDPFFRPLVLSATRLSLPEIFTDSQFFSRSLFFLDCTSLNRRVASVVESDGLWRTCGSRARLDHAYSPASV